MMWPEVSAGTWWALAAALAIILGAMTYWAEIARLYRGGRQFGGGIPLIEGVELAWTEIRKTSGLPDGPAMSRFRDLTHHMFNGTETSVPLYGRRPPFRNMVLIENSHYYEFSEDGSAANPFQANDQVVDLHVRRADVIRWVEDYNTRRRP